MNRATKLLSSVLTTSVSLAFAGSTLALELSAFQCTTELAEVEQSALIRKVQSSYQTIDTISGGFVQRSTLAGFGDFEEQSEGRVFFKKPGKMRWEYQSPEEELFLLNDNTFWHYQPRDNQVLIDELGEILVSDLPIAFLLGVGNLEQEFNLTGACRTAEGLLLRLVPKLKIKQGDLKEFSLLVDAGKNTPLGAKIINFGGNQNAIFLTNVQLGRPISDEQFEAKFPDGTDRNDRRGKRR